jgi:hypothetical protein
MRRLLLGVLAGSLLALIGLQAGHAHAGPAPENCSVCALGHQAQSHAPAAAPRVENVLESFSLPQTQTTFVVAAFASSARSRGPPSLS